VARKKKHPEHVNHERWLISYADFVTLLFAFFTSMYAISTVDAKKAGQMVFSTRAAFNMEFFPTNNATLGGTDRAPDPLDPRNIKIVQQDKVNEANANPRSNRMRDLDGVARQIEVALSASQLKASVKVRRVGGNLIISLGDAAFFESGRATIRPASLGAFHKIAATLVGLKQSLRIEGHTDDQPVGRGPYRSNMELSAARAATVFTYLSQEFTYPPELMSIAGFAGNKPAATNETAEGRAMNRRVDIVVTSPEEAPLAPKKVDPVKAEELGEGIEKGLPQKSAPADTGHGVHAPSQH
jgi:chemotaxis protein MotB